MLNGGEIHLPTFLECTLIARNRVFAPDLSLKCHTAVSGFGGTVLSSLGGMDLLQFPLAVRGTDARNGHNKVGQI
jgi:hypothetical protein